MSPLAWGLVASLLLNLLIFPIAYRLQTDKLTDVTYCLSFLGLVMYGMIVGDVASSLSKVMVSALIIIWAFRLGAYLYRRVSILGKDDRFDEIRVSPRRFLRFFVLQGFSAWVIALPFLYLLLSQELESEVHMVTAAGLVVAIVGLILETVADHQKSAFKNQPGNRNRFYDGGLYSWIRYPNYLGEMLFWIGIFIMSIPVLSGWRWLAVLSPIIIILLLLFVSGVPFIEKSRDKKYGDDPDYQQYISDTSIILPGVY
ncbi:MAG: DUF1295 domain-containing protein [Bacteroidota bacterium]